MPGDDVGVGPASQERANIDGAPALAAQLSAVLDYDLRHPMIVTNHAGSAYMRPRARKCTYIWPVLVPYQDGKDLIWKRGIEIDEGWLASAGHRGMFVLCGPTNSSAFAIMFPGLRGGDGLALSE